MVMLASMHCLRALSTSADRMAAHDRTRSYQDFQMIDKDSQEGRGSATGHTQISLQQHRWEQREVKTQSFPNPPVDGVIWSPCYKQTFLDPYADLFNQKSQWIGLAPWLVSQSPQELWPWVLLSNNYTFKVTTAGRVSNLWAFSHVYHLQSLFSRTIILFPPKLPPQIS